MQELRQQIRDIDQQILKLVAERLELARAIAKEKQTKGLPTKNFKVERDLIKANTEAGLSMGLDKRLVTELTERLIHYSTITQEELRLSHRQQHAPNQHVVLVGGHGQMGRWFADFFASQGYQVSCYDPVPHTAQSSSYTNLSSLGAACEQADILVLATPLGTTAKVLAEVVNLGCKGLVFDIASLKSPLLSEIERAVSQGLRIASIHPMFGPDARLLSGRNILICDFPGCSPEHELLRFLGETSAAIFHVSLAQHDVLMNMVLGLSHLLNIVFADVLTKSALHPELIARASSSTFAALFSVADKVVHENEALYFAIQHLNEHRSTMHQLLRDSLEQILNQIASGNQKAFETTMQLSRRYFDDVASQL